MIVNDKNLVKWGKGGGLSPFSPGRVQGASVDLTIADVYRRPFWYWRNPIIRPFAFWLLGADSPVVGKPQRMKKKDGRSQLTIWPYQFYLLQSRETVRIPSTDCAMLLDKSSTGRRGLNHFHAGWGDPGFEGVYVFEYVNLSPKPITIYAGESLNQIILMRLTEPATPYSGHYQNQDRLRSAWMEES